MSKKLAHVEQEPILSINSILFTRQYIFLSDRKRGKYKSRLEFKYSQSKLIEKIVNREAQERELRFHREDFVNSDGIANV